MLCEFGFEWRSEIQAIDRLAHLGGYPPKIGEKEQFSIDLLIHDTSKRFRESRLGSTELCCTLNPEKKF